MKVRALATVFALLAVPVALAAYQAVSYHLQNRSTSTLVSAGQTREFILHVPASYDRTKPTPLVISMHGAAGWPAQQRDISGWNAVADREGFIVAYPAGYDGPGPRVWRIYRGSVFQPDVKFIADLIDTLSAEYNIDASRVFANGLSNGGGMAFALSCTLSDRIAAVGMVGPALTVPWSWCSDPTPVPMILFHGTADYQVRYGGGASVVTPDPFPAIEPFTASWAHRNGCAEAAQETRLAADVIRRSYVDCDANASVELYTILGGGHTWPGGAYMPQWLLGPTTRSIDASSEMWEFFRAHPRATSAESARSRR